MHLPGHHQQYLLELLGPQPLQPQPQLQPAPGAAQQQPLPPQAHNPRQILFHRNEQPLPPQPVPVPVQLAGHPLARLAEAQQHHPAGQNIQVINQPGIVPVANYNRDRFAAAQRQLFPHERMRMPIQFHNPTTGEIREIYEIDAPAIQPGAIFQPPQNFLAGVPPPAHNPNHPHPPPIRTPNTGNQPGSEQPPARPNVENHAQNFAMHYVPHYGHPNGGQPHAR
ncbi:hypothetical protein FQN49_006639 [Arthroderma sp. PD_2]|nr:hypothetical protein FQN49_006639 [Arthroderma sp. PD_2]